MNGNECENVTSDYAAANPRRAYMYWCEFLLGDVCDDDNNDGDDDDDDGTASAQAYTESLCVTAIETEINTCETNNGTCAKDRKKERERERQRRQRKRNFLWLWFSTHSSNDLYSLRLRLRSFSSISIEAGLCTPVYVWVRACVRMRPTFYSSV